MKKHILILVILAISLNLGKAARVISDQDIKWWYAQSDLVILCSVNGIDTILISHVDSVAPDGTKYTYDLIRETYYISIDSILKQTSSFDKQFITVSSQVFTANYSVTKENEGVIYRTNESGDTISVEDNIEITMSQLDYSDDSYFRIKSNKQHFVILSKTNDGYMIDFASEFSLGMQNLIQDYKLYNEMYNKANYDFVNSICRFHIKDGLEFYQLYYKPAIYKFNTAMEDSLSKYLSDTDALHMKRQTEYIDLDFIWCENRLENCKVLNEKERLSNRKEIPVYSSALLIDSKTNKPIKQERIHVPNEIRQIYSFTKPIWNLDSTYVVFHSDLNEVNSGSSKTYLYKKVNDSWLPFREFYGVSWDQH